MMLAVKFLVSRILAAESLSWVAEGWVNETITIGGL